jgi:hypothetical protein
MKKILFAAVIIAGSFTAFSQNLASTNVPQPVKSAFAKAHPNAKAKWELEDAAYEATFSEGGKSMSTVISKQGTILETESAIAFNELPAGAKNYVNEHYKGKKIKEVAKIVKANGDVNYEVNVQGKDVLFDSNGNFIEKPKEQKEKD